MGELKVAKDFLPPPDQLALNGRRSEIMKRMISIGLWIVGGLLLLIALVSGVISVLSFVERSKHGPGLLFADVEIFGMIALIAVILGAAMLFAAKKLSAFDKRNVPQHNPTHD